MKDTERSDRRGKGEAGYPLDKRIDLLLHQQKYIQKLSTRQDELYQSNGVDRREFCDRIKDIENSPLMRTLERISSRVNDNRNIQYGASSRNNTYFNIENSYPPKPDNTYLQFRHDQNIHAYATNTRIVRPHRLNPIKENKSSKTESGAKTVVKNQLSRLDSHHRETKIQYDRLPQVIITAPQNTPSYVNHRVSPQSSIGRIEYRLSSNPYQTEASTTHTDLLFEREKTDYEPIETISARNKINVEEYFMSASHEQESKRVEIPRLTFDS